MNVQFNLNGISLKQSEAETLLATAGTPSIQLDIGKYLSKGQLSVKKLFDLSIEKQRPELAALAAKLAIKLPHISKTFQNLKHVSAGKEFDVFMKLRLRMLQRSSVLTIF